MVVQKKITDSKQLGLMPLNKALSSQYTSLQEVPMEQLVKYMRQTFPKKDLKQREEYWDSLIADPNDLLLDLHSSNYPYLFDIDSSKKNSKFVSRLGVNLAPRAVEGHAHEGHETFRYNPKENTSLFDIISDETLAQFLDRKGKPYYGNLVFENQKFSDPSAMKYRELSAKEHYLEESQTFIDDVVYFLEGVLHMNQTKVPLRGLRHHQELINAFFPSYITSIDTMAVLKGAIFGANFDNYEDIRKPAEEIFSMRIGGGTHALLNIDKAKRYAITLRELARSDFHNDVLSALEPTRRMELFKKLGIITQPDEVSYDGVTSWKDIQAQGTSLLKTKQIPIYIRMAKGRGVSDDAACIFVAFHDFKPKELGRTAFWYDGLQRGAHLLDAIDTMEKASTYFFSEGQDQVVANYISRKWWNKVKQDRRYRVAHNISLKEIEKRIEDDNSLNFVLFPKDELIDLTAASANPQQYFSNQKIHSSLRYFLQYLKFKPGRITHSRKVKSKRILSNVFTQEKIFAQRLLKKHGVDMYHNGSLLVPGKLHPSEISIGFDELQGIQVFDYLAIRSHLLKNPEKRRDQLINRHKVNKAGLNIY